MSLRCAFDQMPGSAHKVKKSKGSLAGCNGVDFDIGDDSGDNG